MLKKHILFISLLFLDTALIVVAVYLGTSTKNPLKFFEEGQFITWVSALHLIAVAVFSFMILNYRCQEQKSPCWRSPSVIWLLVAVGFIFLAGDELLQLHEKADTMIHHILAMKETRMSDRIDDLIIGVYLLVGAAFLYGYRQELLCYMRIYPFIITGFVISIIMVFLDMYTNLAPGDWISPTIYRLSIVEDALKIYAELFFLLAFYDAARKARYHVKTCYIPEKNVT